MYGFDRNKIRIERVKFKRVTVALGGYCQILDEKKFEETGEESFIKIDVPLAVARAFAQLNKVTKFYVPHEGAIVFYEDAAIALELASFNDRMSETVSGGKRVWISAAEQQLQKMLTTIPDDSQWLFDGQFVYQYQHKNPLESATSLGGGFYSVECWSRDLTKLGTKKSDFDVNIPRVSIAYCPNDELVVVSPPVWKSIASILDMYDDDGMGGVSITTNQQVTIEQADQRWNVTVMFALFAGREVASAFSYEAIAPLQLPRLMVEHRTVNLTALDRATKNTSAIGLSFSHALAWLLGLQYRSSTFQQFSAVRRLLKNLTTKGVFKKGGTNKNNLVKDYVTGVGPAVPLQEAKDIEFTAGEWAQAMEISHDVRRVQDAMNTMAMVVNQYD